MLELRPLGVGGCIAVSAQPVQLAVKLHAKGLEQAGSHQLFAQAVQNQLFESIEADIQPIATVSWTPKLRQLVKVEPCP